MSEDISATLLRFDDDFKKSRRNSLVWSSITILACLGESLAAGGQKAASPSFALGLAFDKSTLVISAALVATFMIVGFIRVDSIIRLLNSQTFREIELDDLTKSAINIQESINKYVREIDNAASIAEGVKNDSKGYISRLKSGLELDISNLLSTVSNSGGFPRLHMDATDQMKATHWEQAYATLQQGYQVRVDAARKAVAGILDELEKSNSKYNDNISDSLKSILEITSPKIDEISQMSNSMRVFHEKIGTGQKRWYKYWDRWLTYALYLSALTVLAISFYDSSLLEVLKF